jgi:hypothetical protein
MTENQTRALVWMARGFAILFLLFVSMFALDVFGAGYSPLETLVALTMHLIPSMVILGIIVLAWRWPWVGTVAFLGFALWYLAISWDDLPAALSAVLLLSGIPTLVAILYLLSWWLPHRASHA